MKSWLRAEGEGSLITVHVQPGARRTEIVGEHGDALKIRLLAPPVDGKANEALLSYLADKLALSRREVELRAGTTSRRKLVAVALAPAEVLPLLG